MSVIFENGTSNKSQESSPDIDRLCAQIGQLKVENDYSKKVQRDWGYQTKNRNKPEKINEVENEVKNKLIWIN